MVPLETEISCRLALKVREVVLAATVRASSTQPGQPIVPAPGPLFPAEKITRVPAAWIEAMRGL